MVLVILTHIEWPFRLNQTEIIQSAVNIVFKYRHESQSRSNHHGEPNGCEPRDNSSRPTYPNPFKNKSLLTLEPIMEYMKEYPASNLFNHVRSHINI